MSTPDGYELLFNRDERADRAPELPPAVHEQGGTKLIAPLDGQARGTWLSVSEHGVTVGIMNAYTPSRDPAAGSRSRGLLTLDLADSRSLAQLHARLEATDLAPYEPFVLLALAPSSSGPLRPPIVCEWDGILLRIDSNAQGRMPLASSGVHAAQATRSRRELLELLTRSHGTLDRSVLLDFHASHGETPGALSPCMHRDNAGTRSLCHVIVDGDRVSMVHAPGAPCRTQLGSPLVLARA